MAAGTRCAVWASVDPALVSADDAKLVEESFAARMALQPALPESLRADDSNRSNTAPTVLGIKDAAELLRQRGAPERSIRPLGNLLRHQCGCRPSTTMRRLRRILEPTLLPQKSRKASSRSASLAGIATKAISNSLHRPRCQAFAGLLPEMIS